MHIRRGRPAHLDSLIALEDASFELERRESAAVLRHSLHSRHQEVWVAEENSRIIGSLFLRFHSRTAKIHSIAIEPSCRGTGTGSRLLQWAGKRALRRGCSILSLEADARNAPLLKWYERHGFTTSKVLDDYYAPGWPARRLRLCLESES